MQHSCAPVFPPNHANIWRLTSSSFFEVLPSFSVTVWWQTLSHSVIVCRYESPEIALNCGIMLRECIRHEPLAKITLYSQQFYDFFTYVEMSTFDIASDAFATFKVCAAAPSPLVLAAGSGWLYLNTPRCLLSGPPHKTQATERRVPGAALWQSKSSPVYVRCLQKGWKSDFTLALISQ